MGTECARPVRAREPGAGRRAAEQACELRPSYRALRPRRRDVDQGGRFRTSGHARLRPKCAEDGFAESLPGDMSGRTSAFVSGLTLALAELIGRDSAVAPMI